MKTVIVSVLMFNIPIGLMLWIACEHYGNQQFSVWLSLMLAQILGAVQVPLYVDMYRRAK